MRRFCGFVSSWPAPWQLKYIAFTYGSPLHIKEGNEYIGDAPDFKDVV